MSLIFRQAAALATIAAATGCASIAPARPYYSQTDARIEEYVALRQRVIDEIGRASVSADASRIEARAEALAGRIVAARPGAEEGDLLGPDAPLIRTRLSDVLTGAHGASLTMEVCDENPLGSKAAVNSPYPAPVRARMPNRLLHTLPKLPEPLQFRVVGRDLALIDGGAALVIDLVRDVLPSPCGATSPQ